MTSFNSKTEIKKAVVMAMNEILVRHIAQKSCGECLLDFNGRTYNKNAVILQYQKYECTLKIYVTAMRVAYSIFLNTQIHPNFQTEIYTYSKNDKHTDFIHFINKMQRDFDWLITKIECLEIEKTDEEVEEDILRGIKYKEDVKCD